jgi:imidazolonepropionase
VKTVAVLHAKQLVTLAGPARPRVGAELSDLGIIADGGLLVRDDIVVQTGTSDEIERAAPADAEIVDAAGRVVLPGFVDAHAHPVFAGNRVDEFEMRAGGAYAHSTLALETAQTAAQRAGDAHAGRDTPESD